jgi:AcrR family transcriptional regulator
MKRPRAIAALYDRYLRKAPKQSRSRNVVESLLTAAADLISHQDDDDAVTVQNVAARAGVGVGSLYDYFEDRGSLFSGLAAKITEDNLRRFEAQLETMRNTDLRDAIGQVIDLMFATYLDDVRVPRAVLRIAHRIGLMPTLAESQATFAAALARWFRERDDVAVEDVDAAAYVLTNMAMGVVHTTLWAKSPPFARERLRSELLRACVAYLARPGYSVAQR